MKLRELWKLKKINLPKYSKGEELFNMISHIIGAWLGVATLVIGLIISIMHKDKYAIASSTIFGTTLIILYAMSSTYHGLSPKKLEKRIFRIVDHCSIFLLIAGSYTPFALCTLREYNSELGWGIFITEWVIAIIGIILNSIDLKKFTIISMICYLAMGWCIIVKANILPSLLGIAGMALLLVGGIIYTIGAVLYGLGRKHKWMHSIFHLCCVLGSLLHIICVLLYVI